MKYTTASVAAFAAVASAAHPETNWGVLRFNGKETTMGRIDPIVSPGKTAQHVHGAIGGSAFNIDSTGESMAKSKCTSAKVKEDKSAYWFPWLYFQDPESGEFEPVDIFYTNVYYFFEKSDDDIKPFPKGLQLVAGDPTTRVAPKSGGVSTYIADKPGGYVQPVQWTCPRDGNNFDNPPSWPTDSDGSTAGIRDPINHGVGSGFPDVNCDGFASPLRADIQMPSCYNPEAGLTNYQENSAYPYQAGNGKVNCPEGYIHVPRMFYEIYWDTPKFAGRWVENQGTQPFVLSNGDVTGFSSHADFLAAWDEDVLQNLIDNCNGQHAGLHTCGGVTVSEDNECKNEQSNIIDEKVTGVLSKLPGDRPLEGWAKGLVSKPETGSGSGDNYSAPKPKPQPKPESPAAKPTPEVVAQEVEAPEYAPPAAPPVETPAPVVPQEEEEEDKDEDKEEPKPPRTRRIKTVWETVTITATRPPKVPEAAEAPKDAPYARRHLHNHAARHHDSHL